MAQSVIHKEREFAPNDEDGNSGFKLPVATFKPLGTLVVLKMYDVRRSEKGILMPDGVQVPDETPRGRVVNVGAMVRTGLKRGDEVLVDPLQRCTKVKHKGVELLVVAEHQIIGRVNDLDRVDPTCDDIRTKKPGDE